MRDPGPKASIFVVVIAVVVVVAVEVEVVGAVEGVVDGTGVGVVVVAEAKLETRESARASKAMRSFILRALQEVARRPRKSCYAKELSDVDCAPSRNCDLH